MNWRKKGNTYTSSCPNGYQITVRFWKGRKFFIPAGINRDGTWCTLSYGLGFISFTSAEFACELTHLQHRERFREEICRHAD